MTTDDRFVSIRRWLRRLLHRHHVLAPVKRGDTNGWCIECGYFPLPLPGQESGQDIASGTER